MLSLGNVPTFLTRLGGRLDPDERRRVERVLASARVLLACTGLFAIYLDPTEPTRYAHLAYVLLLAFVAYSVLIWGLLNRRDAVAPVFPWIHIADLIFPAAMTLITEGPNSAFFLYFVFVLTAASFRWGFIETFATSLAVVTIMVLEAIALSFGSLLGNWVEGDYDINRFVIRSIFLMMLGLLLGYLAEEEKELRAEAAFITRMTSFARLESGMRGTMHDILGHCLRLFASPRALAILEQPASGRMFVWESHLLPNGGNSISVSEIASDDREQYRFTAPVHSCFSQQRGSAWATWAIDDEGRRIRPDIAWSPAACAPVADATSLLAVSITVGAEWKGAVLLPGAQPGSNKLQELRFAQKLFRQIGPAIYTVYLLRRLRSRAGAVERARVARELHDGAIQSIIAVEMEVDVLRREAAKTTPRHDFVPRLERIQEMLREQVLDLRTLMQQMRPVSSAQLLDSLADAVERFRRDTGIAAEFICNLDDVDLSPRVCRELVRIAQEALANVRKHSGARHVLVRFKSEDGKWILAIEDDGRGFEFSGRKTLPEMDRSRTGPAVIKERVRILGGALEIESLPGQGTRVEATFPHQTQATYV